MVIVVTIRERERGDQSKKGKKEWRTERGEERTSQRYRACEGQ